MGFVCLQEGMFPCKFAPYRKGCPFFFYLSIFGSYINPSQLAGLPAQLPAINVDAKLHYIICCAVFQRSQTAVAIGCLCCAQSQALSSSTLPNNSLIINGSYHRSLSILSHINEAFVTATALQYILLMNQKILTPGRFDSFIFFYQTAANLNTVVVQCHQ